MSDGPDFGDFFLAMMIGHAIGGRRDDGHSHGDHWHSHPCPTGLHVHDGHLDGPIRRVAPPPPPPREPMDPLVTRAWARIGAVAFAALALWVGGAGSSGGMVLLGLLAAGCGLAALVISARIEADERQKHDPSPEQAVPGEDPSLGAEILRVYRRRKERRGPPALPPGERDR